MNKSYDLAVIGAGSAGLVAAITAQGMGAKVLLAEGRKMGGDCLNYGCVPSKTFLKAAHLAHSMRMSEAYGIQPVEPNVSLEQVMQRVKDVIAEIAPHDSEERYRSLGVDVLRENASFVSERRLQVGEQVYEAKRIIIATGSHAAVPPIQGLSQVPYYTNETIFEMKTLPKHLIVLGAGPIGCELGQGFAHLGSRVSIIDRSPRLFSKDESEVAPIMEKVFLQQGINLHLQSNLQEIHQEQDGIVVKYIQDGENKTCKGDALLLALGRVPNTENLCLQQVGIQTDKRGFISVNSKLQTNLPHVYACGDVRGKYMFTHMASYEAGIAVRNALVAARFNVSYKNITWTTYTLPRVAHVGFGKKQAEEAGVFSSELMLAIDANDRAKAEGDRDGFVKVILDAKRRVIGASMVGEKADEMLPVLSLMVSKKMKLSAALSVIYAYPVQGEIIKSLAVQDFKNHVKPWQQSWLKKIIATKR